MSLGRPPAASARWTEWVAVVVLVAMAGVLLWVNVSLWKRPRPPAIDGFDLKNPMLDARPRECVEAFNPDAPRDAPCLSVRDEGVVLRPSSGPTSLGDRIGLKRVAPYLAARERYPAKGETCASGKPAANEQVILYPLNAFGIPSENVVRPDSLRPIWVDHHGRQRLVYEAILEDMKGSTWRCYLSPDALVTGLMQVELATPKAGSRKQVFRYTDLGDCP